MINNKINLTKFYTKKRNFNLNFIDIRILILIYIYIYIYWCSCMVLLEFGIQIMKIEA